MSENSYKPRVLIVDDERNIADTLAMVFKMKGHEAIAAYSAESAVELIETFEPDIVLSDVIMGRMTGVDLAIYLSRARPRVQGGPVFRADRDRGSARRGQPQGPRLPPPRQTHPP